MARQAVRKIQDELNASLEYVTREREIIVFRKGRRGKPVAALVPVESDEALEALEDEIDAREARKAIRERSIPWEQVKKDLDL
jgi:antitoxin (DNA-binding transcriptional repressor) of toxin-antitoxin stability system